MEMKTKKAGNRLYIELSGDLDDHAATAIRYRLDDILDGETMGMVIFDLAKLAFTDSTGIGLLIGRYKKLKARGVPAYIKNVSSHVEKVFKMTGLFEIMPKIEEA